MIVLICRGPMGAGMEEIYQVTSALKHLQFGKHVAVVTDARFSGVSTGACIGHVGPEALAGGPIGKVLDGDLIRITIDRNQLVGTIDLVGTPARSIPAPSRAPRCWPSGRSRRPGRGPEPARRHPPLGRPAKRQRRHLGRMRLRRPADSGVTVAEVDAVDGPQAAESACRGGATADKIVRGDARREPLTDELRVRAVTVSAGDGWLRLQTGTGDLEPRVTQAGAGFYFAAGANGSLLIFTFSILSPSTLAIDAFGFSSFKSISFKVMPRRVALGGPAMRPKPPAARDLLHHEIFHKLRPARPDPSGRNIGSKARC